MNSGKENYQVAQQQGFRSGKYSLQLAFSPEIVGPGFTDTWISNFPGNGVNLDAVTVFLCFL